MRRVFRKRCVCIHAWHVDLGRSSSTWFWEPLLSLSLSFIARFDYGSSSPPARLFESGCIAPWTSQACVNAWQQTERYIEIVIVRFDSYSHGRRRIDSKEKSAQLVTAMWVQMWILSLSLAGSPYLIGVLLCQTNCPVLVCLAKWSRKFLLFLFWSFSVGDDLPRPLLDAPSGERRSFYFNVYTYIHTLSRVRNRERRERGRGAHCSNCNYLSIK